MNCDNDNALAICFFNDSVTVRIVSMCMSLECVCCCYNNFYVNYQKIFVQKYRGIIVAGDGKMEKIPDLFLRNFHASELDEVLQF